MVSSTKKFSIRLEKSFKWSTALVVYFGTFWTFLGILHIGAKIIFQSRNLTIISLPLLQTP